MAQHNTHRSAGRAVTPVANAHHAARGLGGAAVLGTVLVGSAFTGGAASASDQGLGGGQSPAGSSQSQSAPADTVSNDTAPTLDTQQKLRQGSQGENVEDLQNVLNAHGAELPETGYFGTMTHQAVVDHQTEHGLQIDGVVGPETRGSLNGDSSGSGGGGDAQTMAAGGGAGAAVTMNASSSSSNAIVEAAKTAVESETPYAWGKASLSAGMDCSGLVNYAYEAAGIDVPRTSGAIAAEGRSISQAEAQPGDLVIWPGHVAIYIGDGQIIDASGSKQEVVKRGIWGNPTGFVTYR